MNGASLSSFFAMGGYAVYVWPAYGVFIIVLLMDWLAPQFRRRRVLREVRSRMARQDGRKARASAPASLEEEGRGEGLRLP
ncbi:heme exporter protein CcmD [Dyella monticola]|uniref:Heme exporter protein D n=1 Tax=Dyella monticola TaxID=1927958 RepID=A0A370WWY2_9GAMM|nr:heme exporter protein CcmD [Dyella monticola]RDS80566.1 heme exporter protein CcmD [Dyella monticola]